MKKILHIHVIPKMSGVQNVSLEIMKSLPDSEYEKCVMFSSINDIGDTSECRSKFEAAGCRVIFSNNLRREICLRDIKVIREIYALCRREKFDIVHTHSTKPGVVGRVAATIAHVPLVIHTVHGLAFHRFVKFPKWQFYWACEMFSSLFCHKITMVNKFYRHYFAWLGAKVTTIYNGVDFGRFKSICVSSRESCNILFVGRLDTPKNLMTTLRVAKEVVSQRPFAKFIIVGDGEMYDQCRDYIVNNDLEQSVTLEGWQSNVAAYYASADIFFAPSIYESFGLMFVEAGYYKLPIVASNVEGIPEVVADGVTGLLSDPLDVSALTHNIIMLIDNKGLRSRLGEQCYERVTTNFSVDQMVYKYKKVYENS